jgi:glycerophosphoryl diester phosphodiesterase
MLVRIFTSSSARVLASRISCFRRVNGGAHSGKEKFPRRRAAPVSAANCLVTVLIVAHRGVHEPETPGVRENTLAAFRGAVGSGADGVELDVRRTADGTLVVLHDAAVEGLGPIATLPAAALPDWIPTLAEALEACAGLAFVDVEIKNSPLEPGFDPGPGLAAAVAAEVLASPVAPRAVVTSFHLDTLDGVRIAAPGLATGWLTMPGYDQQDALRMVAGRGHRMLAPPDRATDQQVVSAARLGRIALVVWTVNVPERVAELASWGVEACVTDRPLLAASVVR